MQVHEFTNVFRIQNNTVFEGKIFLFNRLEFEAKFEGGRGSEVESARPNSYQIATQELLNKRL